MPPDPLSHLCFTQLDASTWCMSAQIIPDLYDRQDSHECNNHQLHKPSFNHERQQQRKGVRDLLQCLLYKLNIRDDLDETQFPYRLTIHRYYVCFSHSVDRVAVVVSTHRPVGIDIEIQSVKWSIVQRYYHVDELAILTQLDSIERDYVSRLLWQIKECFIKVHDYTLGQGMGVNYAHLINELSIKINDDSLMPIAIQDMQSSYQIMLLREQQIVITL